MQNNECKIAQELRRQTILAVPPGYYWGEALGIRVNKQDQPNPHSDLCFVTQTVGWRDGFLIDEIAATDPMMATQPPRWVFG